MNKKTIIIVSDSGREDFIKVFKDITNINFVFVDTLSISSSGSIGIYKKYGRIIFWENYKDAFELLKKNKPSKIVFFNYESFNQVALLSASKQMGVKSFHMEHGLRLNFISSDFSTPSTFSEVLVSILRKAFFIKKMFFIKNHFYRKTMLKSNPRQKKFLKKYFHIRVSNSPVTTFRNLMNEMIKPDHFISPNKITLSHHLHRHGASIDEINFTFIGYPQFSFINPLLSLDETERKIVLLIDQPLSEQKVFGWTKQIKIAFIEGLMENIDSNSFYIKPHPGNELSHYPNGVRLIKDEQFLNTLEKTKVVLGFYSTLMMPLAALEHTTLFVFENHPLELSTKPSTIFTEAGVAHEIKTPKELKEKLVNLEKYHVLQKKHKSNYIKDWNLFSERSPQEELADIIES